MEEQSSLPAADAKIDLVDLPPVGALLDALTGPLAAWVPVQRWYAHKGTGTPTVAIRGWAPLTVAGGHLVLQVVLGAGTADGEALYQVPLVLRPSPGAASAPRADRPLPEEGALIGEITVPGGSLQALDAARDPDGRAALLGLLGGGGGALGPELRIDARLVPGARRVPDGADTRLLSGEQSNSSLIAEPAPVGAHGAGPDGPGAGRDGSGAGPAPVILKLFRLLQHGQNPDVVLQEALGRAGSRRVPPPVGSVQLGLGQLRTHAMLAQRFLPDVEDAWRTALSRARTGTDFSGPAGDLGLAVAEVHRDLAAALGTGAAEPPVIAQMVDRMRERLRGVAAELPPVAAHREVLEHLLERARAVEWPALQRIHGDLHLGQVLSAPGRGWVLLDFEGEPLRPLAQRSQPDSPLRDVAGMLRSLDYVAGAVAHEDGIDASAWAQDARRAFLDGYGHGSATASGGSASARTTLLAAFEADKAVYEALYEARNRPDWLPIPLGALERISAAAGAAGSGD